MKKIIVACFAALLLVFGGVSSAQADEYLRMPTVMTCKSLKKSLKLKVRNL